MKKILVVILFVNVNVFAQTGIGTTTPEQSAQLDVSSTDKGFLPPRMTAFQRDNIGNPAQGLIIFCTDCALGEGELQIRLTSSWKSLSLDDVNDPYPSGTVHCNGTPTAVVDVTNPITGKTWMDRNLGASRAAVSSTDSDAYGDLYQWGRGADGHQCRNSNTTSIISSTDQPGHGDFILSPNQPWVWSSTLYDNLWQGVNGFNNPCPNGYRLPTEAEWEEERLSWSSNDAAGALASPLKLPLAGIRYQDGSFADVGSSGFYASSSVTYPYSVGLYSNSSDATFISIFRAAGFSVRCIKDY